jgi:NHL repeat
MALTGAVPGSTPNTGRLDAPTPARAVNTMKGTHVNPAGHSPKSPSTATGRFVALRSSLRAQGSGAACYRRAPVALCCALALIALAALVPSAASAAQAHKFSAAFGAPGAGAGQLALLAPVLEEGEAGGHKIHELKSGGSGLAVNEETGAVYIADTGNHRVSEFTSTGTPLRSFGADVGGAGVDVCTATCLAGTAGSGPGQFQTPTFIAVDNSAGPSHGDVYVADTGDSFVSKFDSAGKLIESWGVNGQLSGSPSGEGGAFASFGSLNGIAVDTSGNLEVFDQHSLVYRFDQGGTFIPPAFSTSGAKPGGLAVDGAGSSYLLEGFSTVEKLASTGARVGRVTHSPSEGGSAPTGLTADQLHNDLYVDEEGSSIGDISSQCEPSAGECSAVEVFGAGHLTAAAGLAINSATGNLYAAETATDQIAVFAVGLEATIEAASAVEPTKATLHGKVDPEGAEITRCQFEYGETTAYGSVVPCVETPEQIGSGTAPVAVHADLTGIAGGSRYHYRLRASRTPTNDEGNDVRSEDEELTTLPLPTIDEASATAVTATSARLNAKINPRGLETHYRFEYGPCASASTCSTSPFPNAAPEAPADIGSGSADVAVSQQIEGLSPNVTYHFRVAAISATNGTATSPEHTFVFLTEPGQQPETPCSNEALRHANGSLALPDCRAYELVTPARKNGALIGALFLGQVSPQISTDGETVIAPSIQCFADAQSCTASRLSEGEPFEFSRTETGWVTNPLAPPASAFLTSRWYQFNPDAETALFSIPNASGGDDFLARQPDGSFSDIGPIGEGKTSYNQVASWVSSANLSHLVYMATRRTDVGAEPVWSFDQTIGNHLGLYEYVGSENSRPLLVAVSGGPGSTDLIGTCGSELGGGGAAGPDAFGSLSADGRTVYFGVLPCASGSGTNAGRAVPVKELFARIDGEGPGAHTIAISQPGALVSGPPNDACTTSECTTDTSIKANFRDASFEGASNDGFRAFFTSTQQLTDSASQDPSKSDTADGRCENTTGANGCNLYLYDSTPTSAGGPEAGHNLIDVSAGARDGGGPQVQGTVAISPDGSHVYFVAKGVLTETLNTQGERAVEGADNLYLYQRGAAQATGTLTFIASLAPSDRANWRSRGLFQGAGEADVTPDGDYLVFASHRALTHDSGAEGPAQIYRYEARAQALTQVSIGRRGFNDNGNSDKGDASIKAADVSGYPPFRSGPAKANPTMSDDGRYVFFQSPNALAPGALDDVQLGTEEVSANKIIPYYAQNVYEWEEPGAGGCSEPSGCVTLLSDGKEVVEGGKLVINSVELLGTDATGEDVFIAAADPLTWQDTDTQRDYYDLRVNGGFAPPSEPAICKGDACKGPGTQAGGEQGPATPGFNGPSEGPKNPPKATCKKGFVKKGGKCVKKHQTTKKRHKKGQKSHKRTADHDRGGGK